MHRSSNCKPFAFDGERGALAHSSHAPPAPAPNFPWLMGFSVYHAEVFADQPIHRISASPALGHCQPWFCGFEVGETF